MDDFEDKMRLIQCFWCLDYEHTKNKCPYINKPPTCNNCADTGHIQKECVKTTSRCHHCQQFGHPAMARVCPVYRTHYKATMKEIEDAIIAKYLQTSSRSMPNMTSTQHDDLERVHDLVTAVSASISVAYTAGEFVSSLYSILKASSPTGSGPPPALTYGADLDMSDDSIIVPPEDHTFKPAIKTHDKVVRRPAQTHEASRHVPDIQPPQEFSTPRSSPGTPRRPGSSPVISYSPSIMTCGLWEPRNL